MTATTTHRQQRILWIILLLAFGLRIGYGLMQNPMLPYDRAQGGDEWWYLEYSYRQVTDINMEPLSSAPLYLLWVGGVRWLLQPESDEVVMLVAAEGGGLDIASVPGEPIASAVIVVRLIQILMSTATVYFIYRMGTTLADDVRVGLIAAGALAVSLSLILSAARIMTETTYLFFLSWALMLYVQQSADDQPRPLHHMAAIGLLLGLASLTRAVLLLFPLGLLLHAVLMSFIRRRQQRATPFTWRGLLTMMTVYVLLHSVWTGWYYWRWQEVVIGAKGMSAFFYLGTQNDWQGPEHTDQQLGATPENPINDADYLEGAQQNIRNNPLQYAQSRIENLARTYSQPYGTVAFSGPSLKAMLRQWFNQDRNVSGLMNMLQQPSFYPKLMLYLWHYTALGFGLIGVVMSYRRWATALPILGFLAYVTLIHLALLALPRYLFPMWPFWWIFAAVCIVQLWDWFKPSPVATTPP